jgi:hypothetical protein
LHRCGKRRCFIERPNRYNPAVWADQNTRLWKTRLKTVFPRNGLSCDINNAFMRLWQP